MGKSTGSCRFRAMRLPAASCPPRIAIRPLRGRVLSDPAFMSKLRVASCPPSSTAGRLPVCTLARDAARFESDGATLVRDAARFESDGATLVRRRGAVRERRSETRPRRGAVRERRSDARPRRGAVRERRSDARPRRGAVRERRSETRPRRRAVRERRSDARPRRGAVRKTRAVFHARATAPLRWRTATRPPRAAVRRLVVAPHRRWIEIRALLGVSCPRLMGIGQLRAVCPARDHGRRRHPSQPLSGGALVVDVFRGLGGPVLAWSGPGRKGAAGRPDSRRGRARHREAPGGRSQSPRLEQNRRDRSGAPPSTR